MKKIILTLAASSLIAMSALANTDCNKESTFAEIDKAELTQLVEKKAVTPIDVNSKESFAKAHVPGAIHFASASKNFAQALPQNKDALIVAYCGGVKCHAWKKAATEACKLGYTNIKHFKAGIAGWTSGS